MIQRPTAIKQIKFQGFDDFDYFGAVCIGCLLMCQNANHH